MNQFAQGAALIGTQKTVGQIAGGVQPKRIASDSGSFGGHGDQKAIGSRSQSNGSKSASSSGMDTTTQAISDMGGGKPEVEDE
jgi:hypothetical protein